MNVVATWRAHFREYAIEAWGLGTFMAAACAVAALLYHPASPFGGLAADRVAGRLPMGLAMGGVALALVYSPWGRRSGAHFNPAFTLAQYRLGRVAAPDLAGYVAAQFVGAVAGVSAASAALGPLAAHPAVDHAATRPGAAGVAIAFAAEAAIAFVLLSATAATAARPKLERYTGCVAAALVALYIVFEAPLSGMSLNPARTFGSAVFAGGWRDFWIYLSAPVAGMLLAAEARLRLVGRGASGCAKLRHDSRGGCIFCTFARGGIAAPGAR
ncbi:MAG TPA: aquaporin [Planctomycetota bacterium]|nr:aquaporin [Planctomycetota bacterium]